MGDWSHYLWITAPTLLSIIGTVRSWRKQWAGPRGLRDWISRRWHTEKALFDMTQDRDDWRNRANFYKAKSYDLMGEVKEMASLVSLPDSSPGEDAPTVRPTIAVHPRQSQKMPISKRVLRKQKSKPPTQNGSL